MPQYHGEYFYESPQFKCSLFWLNECRDNTHTQMNEKKTRHSTTMRMQKRLNIENIQKKSYVSSYFHRVETTRTAKTTACFFNCYDILNANVQNTCRIYAVRTYSCSIIRFVFYGSMMDSFNLNKKGSSDFQWHARQIYSKVK